MDPVEINENDLFLRPFRPEDADPVHRACQDPDIHRWIAVPSPYLPEHAKKYVTTTTGTAWAEGTGAPFAVCDPATGELLASCGLVTIDRLLRSAEIGYWTAPWARGRGVAVRATRAVARWAFEELGLRRIIWQAEIGNHASRLVALRAGFTVSGQLRLADPRPEGDPDGWIGSLFPADLDRDTAAVAGPGSLAARRAAVFGRAQPVLRATTAAGEPITLRRPEDRDIDVIVATGQDPETIRWTSVPHPYQRSDGEYFVNLHGPRLWARGTGVVFTVADAADRYAGTVDLTLSPVDPRVGDVGFMTAPAARGRGYLPAALRALCAWGFATLDLARIEWRAHVGNTASRRAAEKAGFGYEGTARSALTHRGQRLDAWVGALLPDDLTGNGGQAARAITP